MSTHQDARNKLLISGYIKQGCDVTLFPSELIEIILNYAMILFEFVKRDGCKWEITNKGLTASSPAIYYSVILFGERLHHQNKRRMDVTFRLDRHDHTGIGIGFVTPPFNEYIRNCDENEHVCFMYGNGFFVYDEKEFKCAHPHKKNSGISYFQNIGDTVTLSIDMKSKIAKFKSYKISLPDTIQIAVISASQHIVTIVG